MNCFLFLHRFSKTNTCARPTSHSWPKSCATMLSHRQYLSVTYFMDGPKGRIVTIVAAVSAMGQFVPPAMIFPRKRMNDRLIHDALSGTVGYCSGNGCIDITLFCQYLDHFIEHVRPTTEQKVLLILGNHISHINRS